jgi:hypothetical protein
MSLAVVILSLPSERFDFVIVLFGGIAGRWEMGGGERIRQ